MSQPSRPRYAIYFTPLPGSALGRFGSAVIGDAVSRGPVQALTETRPQPFLSHDIQAEPRRYGFHATLCAPFELIEGRSLAELTSQARSLAALTAPITLPDVRPAVMGDFIALVCPQPPLALLTLASDCVRTFEPFRAPLSRADRERRLGAPLTQRQVAHLDTWGYPYVHDEFVFHMTLTGRLRPDLTGPALALLTKLHAPLAGPLVIDAISVLEQPRREDGFRLTDRIQLGAT